jgi:hypothetical protein
MKAVNQRNPKPYTKRGGLASLESRWFSKVAAQAVLNPKLKPKLNPHQKGTDAFLKRLWSSEVGEVKTVNELNPKP